MSEQRDPRFRPNPKRAVYAFGVFDDALLARIVPEVMRMRHESAEPITVYINSSGGIIRVLEILVGCLSEEDLEGSRCRIITVAVGDATSSAAALLALGEYAMAYERSDIHFHGARFSEVETVTTESAANLAAYLAQRNRQIASKLANAMVRRLAHRYSILRDDFEKLREGERRIVSDLECFVDSLRIRLGARAREILDTTIARTLAAMSLADTILAGIEIPRGQSPLTHDANVLHAVIEHEISQPADSEWRLDEAGCARITADYLLLRDYHLGDHKSSQGWIARNLGITFLTLKEFGEFQEIERRNPDEAEQFLIAAAQPRILPFWYFTICLCRQLQEGENRLSPADAYWLGAIDEVIGTKLQGYRALAESQNPEETAVPRHQ